uniref:Ras-associating domain-containing protein n=2 Tax=Wuchereria bancrofti TaxID=6293 RepID=A0A1I8EM52_WUCBA
MSPQSSGMGKQTLDGMEIRVIVDGIERSVSGITSSTTCAQVIYALAHATGQKGRFVLIEKFGDTERSLAPLDRPLEMLKKRGTHSRCVTFLLKHLDEGPLSVTGETYLVDTDDRLENSQLKEPCFTSLVSSVFQGAHINEQLYRPVFQKTSMQEVTIERIKNRPPPPTYHEVIEQRFTSLSKQNTPFSSLTPLQPADISVDDQSRLINNVTSQPINLDSSGILIKKLSTNALEELIQNQSQIIGQQKTHLARLDLAVDNAQQRELIQLKRQQENLRAVLNPLRERDWPNRLQHERTELQKITATISEFKQKLDAITNEVRLRTEEEQELEYGIIILEEELKQLEDDVNDAILSEINE